MLPFFPHRLRRGAPSRSFLWPSKSSPLRGLHFFFSNWISQRLANIFPNLAGSHCGPQAFKHPFWPDAFLHGLDLFLSVFWVAPKLFERCPLVFSSLRRRERHSALSEPRKSFFSNYRVLPSSLHIGASVVRWALLRSTTVFLEKLLFATVAYFLFPIVFARGHQFPVPLSRFWRPSRSYSVKPLLSHYGISPRQPISVRFFLPTLWGWVRNSLASFGVICQWAYGETTNKMNQVCLNRSGLRSRKAFKQLRLRDRGKPFPLHFLNDAVLAGCKAVCRLLMDQPAAASANSNIEWRYAILAEQRIHVGLCYRFVSHVRASLSDSVRGVGSLSAGRHLATIAQFGAV